jgi:ribosomal protein S6
MDNYELTYLISPDTSSSDILSIQEKIKSFIGQSEGSIIRTTEPIRKLLAYPIKKRGEAFMGDLTFTVAADKLKDFKKSLDAEGSIIRYLLLLKKVSRKPVKSSPKRKDTKLQPKVELKEIEKKLEEILGE